MNGSGAGGRVVWELQILSSEGGFFLRRESWLGAGNMGAGTQFEEREKICHCRPVSETV